MKFIKSALVAGFAAGILVAALQAVTTTPLILEAERYEGGMASAGEILVAHFAKNQSDAFVHLAHGTEAHGAKETWAPEDGLERTLSTSIATIGTTFGFALVLLAAMVLSNATITARTGLIWGAAAFAATGLAPALGLSPELPGAAAAVLEDRQIWWIGTALATAVGLFLALRVSTPLAIVAGLVLIAIPHVIGAPHPDDYISDVPSELSGHFAAASLVVHAVTWAATGCIAGFVWERSGTPEAAAAA
ncbi:CbtA family protein [Nisaea sp.]|uniref:CbtA family protein n=1 Tax=Nisaea sp. TaxID=2024842 RepID=UPI002B271AF4|nr:CbtA family protein [Nisaea sp.]